MENQNMKIYEAHRNPPREALKPISAGRLKGMTDINPMWRIKALTEEFGPCGIGWYYTVDEQRVEDCGNEKVAIVNISLYIKDDGEWSKPIYGTGGSKLVAQERNGLFVSDECFKMATTDAISVACKQLGFAADIYWNNDRDKYTANEGYEKSDEQKNQEMKNRVNPNEVPGGDRNEQIKIIMEELKRTGIKLNVILGTFNVKSIEDLSEAQRIVCINKLHKTKDSDGK